MSKLIITLEAAKAKAKAKSKEEVKENWTLCKARGELGWFWNKKSKTL